MLVLGINAYHPDASAVLYADGELVWAAEEERYDRVKHSWGFPRLAVAHCLRETGTRLEAIDAVAVGKNPRANLRRRLGVVLWNAPTPALLSTCRAVLRRSADLPASLLEAAGGGPASVLPKMVYVEHHTAHVASSFFLSPFDRAAFLSLDGVGDLCSAAWGVGAGTRLDILDRVHYPHSAGFFYTAGTQYLGFERFGDEYKVMGLAAYGRPRYVGMLRKMVRLKRRGGFALDLSYFLHHRSKARVFLDWQYLLYSSRWEEELGPARRADEPIEERHHDVAASLQTVLEEIYFHVLDELARRTGEDRLALAGGVAFNSVANGKISGNTAFKEIFIQPASGDAGTALGAAAYVCHVLHGQPRRAAMNHAYWGSGLQEPDARAAIEARALPYVALDPGRLVERAAIALTDGRVVGWCQGRMEFGPRALGNRSILADARRAGMRELLNRKIKMREPFRPFAPVVPEERAAEFFEMDGRPSPFMVKVFPVREDKKAVIPAVVHVDGTSRVQTVARATNPLLWSLLNAVGTKTGVPVLLNTSFNENEPIVCKAEEALDCFTRTGLDVLVLGPYYLEKRLEGME